MKWILIGVAALGVLVAGCKDDGGNTDAANGTPTASAATPAAFDPALLTSVALNKSDLPGYEGSAIANPLDPTTTARSFTSVFLGPEVRIQSTVVRHPDATAATQDMSRNRQVFATFGSSEANFALEGAEQAFLYTIPSPPGVATWAIVGQYLVFVQIAPAVVESPSPLAADVEQLRAYANTVLERLQRLIDDPSSVTPVPESEFNTTSPAPTP